MILLANGVPKNSVIATDICVIGSGPAGLAFALEFQHSEKKICVLESGGFDFDTETQGLYEFETAGLPISPKSRMRVFGGTGTAWMGLWKPHDSIDFRNRPWVPHSGWPFGRETLEPYYERAANVFNAPGASDYAGKGELDSLALQTSYVFRLAEQDLDLAAKNQNLLENSKNFDVYLEANVVKLESDSAKVTEVLVQTLKGNEFKVVAGKFVLACGGIENARLLLHSRLGNRNVGRYYMDHPKGSVGVLVTGKPMRWEWGKAGLRLSDETQEREGVLNSFILFDPEVGRLGRFAKKFLYIKPNPHRVFMRNHLEQAPVPENRVSLSQKKDRFGNPLAKVEWKINDLDKRTLRVFHKILKEEFRKLGIGELQSPLLSDSSPDFPISSDASHHMGTTRMGQDPRNSVVDENCRLHEMDNLYIAGSSVFPTGGYASPNATIVALAIRLADHLKSK